MRQSPDNFIVPARKSDVLNDGKRELLKQERAISLWNAGKDVEAICAYIFGLPSDEEIERIAKHEKAVMPPSSHSPALMQRSDVFKKRKEIALRWLAKLGIQENS